MLSKKYKKDKHGSSAFKFAAVFLALFTAGFIFVDARLRPLVTETAKYRLKNLITAAANEAIIEEMGKTEISYGDLINLQIDENGQVSILTYNSLEVNRLKSKITSSVIEKVARVGQTDIYIPIFNITNIDFLHNKGPRLRFRITPSVYVETDIESSFENTGINQVNHQIFIVLKITSSALIPNYTTTTQVQTKVCVAQTVIIGKVPNNISDNMQYFD